MSNGHGTGKCRVMVDMHVSAEHRPVPDNHAVSDYAIVCNVDVAHQVAIAADAGKPVFFFGGPVNGNAFTNDISVTDDDFCFSAAVANVLRGSTQYSARRNDVVLTECDVTKNGHVVNQFCSFSDLRFGTDHTKRADLDARPDFGVGVNTSEFGNTDRCRLRLIQGARVVVEGKYVHVFIFQADMG